MSNENITNEKIRELKEAEAKQNKADDEKVLKIVSSSTDTFEKEYHFAELDLKFNVRLKIPSALDLAKISADVERMFDGIASLMPPTTIDSYAMLAMMAYQHKKYKNGEVEIPEMFRNPDKVYNLYPLQVIAKDFNEFKEGFRY